MLDKVISQEIRVSVTTLHMLSAHVLREGCAFIKGMHSFLRIVRL